LKGAQDLKSAQDLESTQERKSPQELKPTQERNLTAELISTQERKHTEDLKSAQAARASGAIDDDVSQAQWTSKHSQQRNHHYSVHEWTPHQREQRSRMNGEQPVSSLTTGNGFGFAVLSLDGHINKLYAHPYRFDHPKEDPKVDGHQTVNFLRSLSFEDQKPSDKCGYLNESQILAVNSAKSEKYYFMPFGLNRNALIALEQAKPGEQKSQTANTGLNVKWHHEIQHDEEETIDGRHVHWLKFKDVPDSLALVPLEQDSKIKSEGSSSTMTGKGWAILPLENKGQLNLAVHDLVAWQNHQQGSELVARELKEMEAWRKPANVHFASNDEQQLWRQSETILRMAQSREPNRPDRTNNGLILASLPDGEWFIPWVRDMSVSVVGLSEMGHFDEARKGVMAYFNAHPVGKESNETRGKDYQPSVVRYFGDGSEEADYSGEKSPNVELDDWGLVLWASSEYIKKSGDNAILNEKTYRGDTVYESMRDKVVEPLLSNMDKYEDGKIITADSSLWEEHQQNKKHFAFSTISAIRGLRGFLPLAEEMNDKATADKVQTAIDDLEKGFNKAFISDGAVRGSVEKSFAHEIDGALTEAFNWDVVNDPKVLENTLKKMELLREPSGGFRRVRGETDYEKQEFLFVDFNLARLYFKMGKPEEGMKLLDTIVKKANVDHGLIPEMYVSELNDEFTGEIGTPTGAIPMVGYGAGIYAITLAERERSQKAKRK
jgi:GH15 family glucan-1,4-alpha-glucosidase